MPAQKLNIKDRNYVEKLFLGRQHLRISKICVEIPLVFVISVNWDDIMDEICRSNIIQRDNVKFAKKLSKQLVPLAKEKNKTVRINAKSPLNQV